MHKISNVNKLKIVVVMFYLLLNLEKKMKLNLIKKNAPNKIKMLLVSFYLVYLLLHSAGNSSIFCVRAFVKKVIFKKIFYKFFYLKSFDFGVVFSKKLFKYYSAFYSKIGFFNNLAFIKLNISFFRLINFILVGTWCRFFFSKIRTIRFRRAFISKYCYNVIRFKKKLFKTQVKVPALKKKHRFLFSKKKNKVILRKYVSYTSLKSFDCIYRGFFGYILKRRISGSTRSPINILFLKVTFYNFLKMVDTLAPLYKEYYHNIYLKKKKENLYVTVTNREGEVIFCNSSGKVGLLKKKQKKSMFALGQVMKPVIKNLLNLNILLIRKFFCPVVLHRLFIKVKYLFLRLGVSINNIIIFDNKAHNFYFKKLKKPKRV